MTAAMVTYNGSPSVIPSSPRVSAGVVVSIGLILLASTIGLRDVADVGLFELIVIGIPGIAMIVLMVTVYRNAPLSEYHFEVVKAAVGGALLSGGFILLVLLYEFYRGTPLVESLPLLVFMTGFGGLAGQLIGLTRAQRRRAVQQAENLERQQDRLVLLNQLLRHHVLNKVGVIRGNAELIDAEYDIDDPYVETIRDHSADVDELINNVRVLVQASSTDMRREPTDLSDALRTEIERLGQSFDDVRVDADVPDDVTVLANDLLRYVFENVLHNAVEHNDAETPRVGIAVERDGDSVVVTVSDNGPGIPPAIRDGIAGGDLEANHGVGLYLVDTLMTEYGGSLDFVETGTGGTELALTFVATDA